MKSFRLNLLSFEKKRSLQRLVYIQFSTHILEFILLLLCLFGLVLLGSEQVLESYIHSISKSPETYGDQIRGINTQIQTIEGTTKKIKIMQEFSVPWTKKMSDVANITPVGITLQSIRFSASGKELSIQGTAKERAELLAYGEALQKLPWLKELNIPLSQLTEKQNVSFAISASLQ